MNIITEEEFDLATNNGTVLVDFFATWCHPCVKLGENLAEIEKELGNKINIYKADVEKIPQKIDQFKIRSVPTTIILKNGDLKETIIGLKSKTELKSIIEKYL